jgi:acetyl-CoA C-acetyltransferase
VPVEIPGRKGPSTFLVDEHNRPDTTIEALSKLKLAFRDGGTITAGNAPGLNTAAAAMVLASETWADRHGLLRQALSRAGWTLGDVERIEINEAFAVITLAVMQELGLSPDIVNVEGGAIAHGHPIGATGAVLTTRLLHSMRRDRLKKGIVTMCIGGGQGIALAVEMTS